MIPTVTHWRGWFAALVLGVAGALACTEHLPEQDLRILSAQPSAKLSASDLWKDFESDPAAARGRYFGRAIDVSDAPTAIEAGPPAAPHLFFGRADGPGVRAMLLDERATEILKDAKVGSRLTLRCFCEGPDAEKNVVLRSCIRP